MTGPEQVPVQWWLSLPQVAEQAGCARSTVLHAITEGQLPSIQTGGPNSPHRVRRDHARTWVLAYRAAPSEEPSLAEKQRQAGVSGSHQRWHVEGGAPSRACRLCATGQGAGQ